MDRKGNSATGYTEATHRDSDAMRARRLNWGARGVGLTMIGVAIATLFVFGDGSTSSDASMLPAGTTGNGTGEPLIPDSRMNHFGELPPGVEVILPSPTQATQQP